MRTALVVGVTAAVLGLAGTGVLAHQATEKACQAGQQCPQSSGGHGMQGQSGHGMHGQARMTERHQRMAERHQRMHGGEAKQDEHKEHKH